MAKKEYTPEQMKRRCEASKKHRRNFTPEQKAARAEASRRYYARRTPEQKLERSKKSIEWNRKNPDRRMAWVRENKARIRATNRKLYFKKNTGSFQGKVYGLWKGAETRAKKKGLDFTITTDDIKETLVCPLLGIPLNFSNNKVGDDSPTLDRIEPAKGYTPDNIWVISGKANRIKNNGTYDEIIRVGEALRDKVRGAL